VLHIDMNIFGKFLAYWLRFPAELKGMKFGTNSFIGPGYDFLFVQLKGITTEDDVMIGKNAWLQTTHDGQISIGEGTNIGRNAVITAQKSIQIGKYCLLSYNVSIYDHEHDYTNPQKPAMQSGTIKVKEVIIEDGCFIGAHSFIMPGVHLEKRCVVGANSVVTKSFPAFSVIGGNPATLIKTLK
jgi:lipopolysaccharide O-acetyltransferase